MKWLDGEQWIRHFAVADIRSLKPAMKGAANITVEDTSPGNRVVCAATITRDSKSNGSRVHASSGINSSQNQGNGENCWNCDHDHHIADCEKFKSLAPTDRLNEVRTSHACFYYTTHVTP